MSLQTYTVSAAGKEVEYFCAIAETETFLLLRQPAAEQDALFYVSLTWTGQISECEVCFNSEHRGLRGRRVEGKYFIPLKILRLHSDKKTTATAGHKYDRGY